MKPCPGGLALLALVLLTAASPVRRSDTLEARRRSAIDRNLVRFGRSYPAEPSAADIREAFQRPTRGNSFLRLGRSQALTLTTDDLINLLRAYEDDDTSNPERRATNFVRLGRDPKFIRFGRSEGDAEPNELVVKVPQRKGRARDNFVRLGRDNEDLGHEEESFEDRKKRSAGDKCLDCQ